MGRQSDDTGTQWHWDVGFLKDLWLDVYGPVSLIIEIYRGGQAFGGTDSVHEVGMNYSNDVSSLPRLRWLR